MAKDKSETKPAEAEAPNAGAAPPVAPLPVAGPTFASPTLVGGQTISQSFSPPRGPDTFRPEVFDTRAQARPLQPEQNEPERSRQALRTDGQDGVTFRPPPGVGLATLGPVVIGNWTGMIDKRPCRVKHGTPVRDLPDVVLDAIEATPDMRIDHFNPNPQASAEPGRR
jgi:hypothetical protein